MGLRFKVFPGLLFLFLMIVSFVCAAAERAEETKNVTLRFGLAPDQMLRYKGTMTNEINWQGTPVLMTHTDIVELAGGDTLDDGRLALSLKYIDSVDKRRIADAPAETFESSVKPKGRTVKVVVDNLGDVKEVHGVIIGIQQGAPMKEFVGRWFFELPADSVQKDSKWVRTVPDSASGEEEDPGIEGSVECRIEKFEEIDGIEVAVIEFKGKFKINQSSEQGAIVGEMENKGKVMVAVEGGYVVKLESSSEMKGEMTAIDEYTGKETTNDMVALRALDVELDLKD